MGPAWFGSKTVMGVDARIEARSSKWKLEFQVSSDEPPCLPAGRDTSFDNDKRWFNAITFGRNPYFL